MNNAQLAANGMAPLPQGFDHAVRVYKTSWDAFQAARQLLESEGQHEDNFNGRGALTERGVRIIRKFFTMGINDADISDIMDMDRSAVFRRRQEWNNSQQRTSTHGAAIAKPKQRVIIHKRRPTPMLTGAGS